MKTIITSTRTAVDRLGGIVTASLCAITATVRVIADMFRKESRAVITYVKPVTVINAYPLTSQLGL